MVGKVALSNFITFAYGSTINGGNNSYQSLQNKDRDVNVFLKMIEEMIRSSSLYDE